MTQTPRSVSFAQSWREHKWEWLVSLIVSVAALIIVAFVLESPAKHIKTYAYVFAPNQQPLSGGYVSNQVGDPVQIDTYGRFEVLPQWHDGSVLFFYSATGKFCGKAILVQSSHGEYQSIQLSSSSQS